MRRTLKIIVLLLVIVAAAAMAVPFVVPMDTMKGAVLAKIETATGRTVSMQAISLSVFPYIAINAAEVKIGNPAWAGAGDMADIKQLKLGVELIPLLSKQVHIKRFTLEEPVITLIRNGDKANWQFGKAASPSPAPGAMQKENSADAPQPVDVAIPAHIAIEGGRVTYQDAAAGTAQDISDINFDFKAPDPEEKAALSASAAVNGQKADLTLTLSNPLGAARGKASDASLKLAFGPLILSWEGTLAVKDAKANLTGTVNIPQIDVGAFSGNSAAKAANTPPGTADAAAAAPAQFAAGRWSEAPINLSGLASANANLTVKVGELILQKTTLKDIAVKVHLSRGALVVSTNEIAAYGGTVKFAFGVSSANEASFAGMINNVKAQPLLRDFAGYDKLSGTLEGQVQLATSGASERDMVAKLSGKGDFQVKDGVWQGRNILAMARNIGTAFGGQQNEATVFSECSGTFTVKDGVVSNNDLALTSPQLRVSGQGTADLPDWQVRYLLNPELVAGGKDNDQPSDASGITVPIRIEGPLDNPRYRPDLQAALKQNLKNSSGVKNTLKKLKNNLLNGGLGGLFR